MNEPFWGNPTSDLKLTVGHQPGLHNGFRLPPLNFPLSPKDIEVRNIPSPIEPNLTGLYAPRPLSSHQSLLSKLGESFEHTNTINSRSESRCVENTSLGPDSHTDKLHIAWVPPSRSNRLSLQINSHGMTIKGKSILQRRRAGVQKVASMMYKTYEDLENILQAKTNLDFLTHLRAYLAKRRTAGDLTSFKSEANFRQPENEKKLSQLAEKLLPEGKKMKLFIDFATDILIFRVRLKLKSIGDLIPDLELFCSAVETEDHKSTLDVASDLSCSSRRGHASTDGTLSETGTEHASAQTCQVNLVTTSMTEIGMTPLHAYIDKYCNGLKPDQNVQDMIDMKSPKEETFLMSLDRYLASREKAGSLGQLLPEVIDVYERYRALRTGEGKHFRALTNLASQMLPDSCNQEIALAMAWILQRRYHTKKKTLVMVFWEDLSHSQWERTFFKSPAATQESVFSFVSSQNLAPTQASGTSSVYPPYTITPSQEQIRSSNEIIDLGPVSDTCACQPESQS